MASKNIFIFGAGDGSQELLRVLIDDINKITPTWDVLGFIDNDPEKVGTELLGYPVFDNSLDPDSDEIYGISGVMDCELRQKIIEE